MSAPEYEVVWTGATDRENTRARVLPAPDLAPYRSYQLHAHSVPAVLEALQTRPGQWFCYMQLQRITALSESTVKEAVRRLVSAHEVVTRYAGGSSLPGGRHKLIRTMTDEDNDT